MTSDQPPFRNLRQHERVSTRLDCQVATPAGASFDATIFDMSAGGLRIACDRPAYEKLIPANQRIPGLVHDVSATIRFSLKTGNGRASSITAEVDVVHTIRLAQDSFHLGVKIRDMSRDDRGRLEKYVTALLEHPA